MLGTRLSKLKKLSITKKIADYHKPKFVYIPLISQEDDNITILVKKGDYVYKGSPIGKRKGNLRIPIHASVSGTVVDFEEHLYSNGLLVKCVVIENDFKEKVEESHGTKKDLTQYTKDEFIELIQAAGIVGLGGSGFPTYIKYNTNKKITTLIINAVECEPYITADFMLIKERCEEILEAIDAILEINHIDEALIAVKKSNTELINIISNFSGTYIKIKIVEVPDLYPMGWERNLVRYLKHVGYNKLPIERGIIVNNASTIYAIYEVLKYNRTLTERVVTFTGEMLKTPQNIHVKIGMKVSEVIESIGGYKRNKDISFVAGGPMMGTGLPSDDLIVTSNLNCVLVLKHTDEAVETPCLRCGKCVEHCPAKLSPVLIRDAGNDIDKLKQLQVNRCIGCGLCSYICPAKIRVRNAVKDAILNLSKESSD